MTTSHHHLLTRGALAASALVALLGLAAPAGAAKRTPTISTSGMVSLDPGSVGGVCTFRVSYTINGLKGRPTNQWTVWITDDSVNGQVGLVTKANDGQLQTATPGVTYAPNFTYPLDGASHTWTVALYDASGTTLLASSDVSASCPGS